MAKMFSENTPDLLRGNTESLLLSLIEALNGAYGYKLIKEIDNRSQGLFEFKEGTVYPALRKLESDGLIKGVWEAHSNGRRRRFYTITEKGKETLKNKIARWQEFTSAMNLILNHNRTVTDAS